MTGSSLDCSATGNPVAALDTGALLAALQLRLPMSSVTTPSALGEVRDLESRAIVESSLEMGRLVIMEPSEDDIARALAAARQGGVEGKLSRTDLEVLALALGLRDRCGKEVYLATDDYALQKAALAARLKVLPVRYRGIRELRGGASPSGQPPRRPRPSGQSSWRPSPSRRRACPAAPHRPLSRAGSSSSASP